MKRLIYAIGGLILFLLVVAIIKFNFINDDIYYQDKNGDYVNDYGRKIEFANDHETLENRTTDLCDENGRRFKTAEEAQKAGLTRSEYGATYCPEYKMDPSWDKNNDGINDCYDDNSCSKDLDYMSPRKSDEELLEQINKKLIQESKQIIKRMPNLPVQLKEKFVVAGNPDAKRVIVYEQGGPNISLNVIEAVGLIKNNAQVSTEDTLIVDVHQCQTLKPEFYSTNNISFEDAKKCDEQTVKTLADTVEYFKSIGKEVYLLGFSFGAFVVEDMIAEYGNIADKNFIVVGRLDMPKEVWSEFAKGNYVAIDYDAEGNTTIVPVDLEKAGKNTIAKHNSSKIGAGISYKRFTQLLKSVNLDNTVYVYGKVDKHVGALNPDEIEFLQNKNVTIIAKPAGHMETTYMFAEEDLKGMLK